MAIFDELKRRKVFRVVSLYAVTAWGASMGAAELFPTFGLADESVRWFVIGAFGLLPVVALLAWLYELTPSGINRDPADLADDNRLEPGRTPNSTQKVGEPYGAQKTAPGELTATWRGGMKSFTNSFTIGRDESCELHIDDPKISRRHVRIAIQQGAWYVEDMGSSNGTSLNGQLVDRAVLPTKSRITLYEGGSDITLKISSSSGSTTVLAGSPSDS